MILDDLNRLQESHSQDLAESVLLRNARELSESYQRQAQGYPSNSRALIQEIASHFSLLDIETIAETLEKQIVPASVVVDEQIEELQMRIEDLKSAPPYHWPSDDDVGAFFRPGMSRPTGVGALSVQRTSRRKLPNASARTSSSSIALRAVCYLKPVTNVGVLIHTLPEKKKAVWNELYTLLALNPRLVATSTSRSPPRRRSTTCLCPKIRCSSEVDVSDTLIHSEGEVFRVEPYSEEEFAKREQAGEPIHIFETDRGSFMGSEKVNAKVIALFGKEAASRESMNQIVDEDPDQADWNTSGQKLLDDSPAMREKYRDTCRFLAKWHPNARAAMRLYRNYIAGKELKLEIEPVDDSEDSDDNEDVREKWASDFMEFLRVNSSSYSMPSHVYRTYRDGEAFVWGIPESDWGREMAHRAWRSCVQRRSKTPTTRM